MLAIATARMARQYLRGEIGSLVDAYFATDADNVLEQHLLAAQHHLEQRSKLVFGTMRIKSHAQPDVLPAAGTYDLLEPPYAWDNETVAFPRWLVRKMPLVSCEGVRFAFSQDVPILTVPDEWLRVEPYANSVTLMPVQGGVVGGQSYESAGLAAGLFIQLFGREGRGWSGLWPQLVYIDYTAGLGLSRPEAAADGPYSGEHADLVMAIAKYAAGEMAIQLGQVENAGLQSVSTGFDGVSQSNSFAGKGAGRFHDYGESLKRQAEEMADFYRQQKHGVKVYL